jgi:hypothetical protein
MNTTKLEIERKPGGALAVRIGDKFDDELTCDEALWVAACYIRDGSVHVYLRTKEEWDRWKAAIGGIEQRRELSETERLLPEHATKI